MKNNLKKHVALFMAMVFAIASLSALSICAAAKLLACTA